MRQLVDKEFRRGAVVPIVLFPEDGSAIQDSPKLTLVVMEPGLEWTGSGLLRERIGEWTRQRGKSPRLYPAALIWCLKKPGRDFQEKVELELAWNRIAKEVSEGTLGGDFDRIERTEIQSKVDDVEEAAKDEVWGGYRFVVLADSKKPDGLEMIDLGAGHSSSGETLCGRVLAALKSQALLNESVGAGYIERNWPPALKECGAWPLTSLRQSFLNGSLTRLLDPDTVLRNKIVEFVNKGDFGLASGQKPDGSYERVWFEETIAPDEVVFEAGVFLLTKYRAKAHKRPETKQPEPVQISGLTVAPTTEPKTVAQSTAPEIGAKLVPLRLVGNVPPEIWNRLGTKVLPKLRSGSDLKIGVEFTVFVEEAFVISLTLELRQIIADLGLSNDVRIG